MDEYYHQQHQQQQQQQQQHQGEGYDNSHHQRQHRHQHHRHQHQQQQQQQLDLSGTSSSPPSSSSSLATDASYYWSSVGGTESGGVGGMHFPSAWNLETGDHECCWRTAKKIWKSGFCYNKRTTGADVKKRNKSCQRFYVTAWTLGLTLGMASTVYSFSQQDETNKVSRLCFWLSIVISCVTGLAHVYVIRKKSLCSRKAWIVSRFVSSIVGVSTVACLTAVGTFSVVDAHGLFMLCGFLSVLFYVSTACALSKRLYWEYKREFVSVDGYTYPPVTNRDGGTERRRRRRSRSENGNNYNILDRPHTPGTTNRQETVDSRFTPSDDVFIVYNEHDGRVFEMLRADEYSSHSIVEPNGRFNISSSCYFNYAFQFDSTNNINNNINNNNNNNYTVLNRNSMSGIGLPILYIPSYDDAIAATGHQLASTQPPKYSEYDKNTSSSSSPSREPDLSAANSCTNIPPPPPSQDQFVDQQEQDFPAERPPEYTESESCFEQEVTTGCVASATEPQGTNCNNNNNSNNNNNNNYNNNNNNKNNISHNEDLSVGCSTVEQHCESHQLDRRDIS